jgi:hypothetical protein
VSLVPLSTAFDQGRRTPNVLCVTDACYVRDAKRRTVRRARRHDARRLREGGCRGGEQRDRGDREPEGIVSHDGSYRLADLEPDHSLTCEGLRVLPAGWPEPCLPPPRQPTSCSIAFRTLSKQLPAGRRHFRRVGINDHIINSTTPHWIVWNGAVSRLIFSMSLAVDGGPKWRA